MHNINTLITYNYTWFAATCFDVNTSSSGSSSYLAKITYIVDIDKMELLKYKIWSIKYKIKIFHKTYTVLYDLYVAAVYFILYFVLHILYFNNSILLISTIILARHEELPEDDVLTSKHVAANHMQLKY